MVKLSPMQEREMLEKAAEGLSARAIAEYFTSQGTPITRQAINARLAATRQERGDIAKAVTRERLAPIVTSDLDHLARIRKEVAEYAAEIRSIPDMAREWTAMKRLELDVVDKRLHYAGADSEGLEKTSDDELRELVKKAAAVLAEDDA